MRAERSCNTLALLSTSIAVILVVQSQCVLPSAGANNPSMGQIQNLRAYVYFPMRARINISALVVWDPPQVAVNSFTVQITCSGSNKSVALMVSGRTTSTTLDNRDRVNSLQYILSANKSCVAIVSANSTQASFVPSSVNFTTYAASPPVAVLAVVSGEALLMEGGNTLSYPNASLPLAVNTIGRELYWYSSTQGMLLRMPFNGGQNQPLISAQSLQQLNNAMVLAMAYEWVGEKVYFISSSSGQLTLWRVPIINPNGLENVTSLGSGSSVNSMIVDPFSGYLYWSADSSGIKTINLKQNASQKIGTISFQHSAFTMDSATGDLWLSTSNGDILTYSASTGGASHLAVNATLLLASSGKTMSDLGLPATSIALDEYRVYWTNSTSGGIFFAWRNSTSSAVVFNSTVTPSAIFSISPGQQPLPPVECLSYDTAAAMVMTTVQAFPTSTTILFKWNKPPLPTSCQNVTLDFATLAYVIDVQQSQQRVLSYPNTTTFDTQYLVQGLLPFLDYSAYIYAYNKYTVADVNNYYLPNYGGIVLNPPSGLTCVTNTKEGVPLSPQGLIITGIGTQNISLQWNLTSDLALAGNKALRVYYIQPLGLQSASTPLAMYTIQGLSPGTSYTIMVITSNGVLNSTAATVNASTWPLPPTPMILSKTNMSVVVMVNMTSLLNMNIISRYYILSSNGWHSEMTSDPVKVFNISELEVYTEYSILTVGLYTSQELQQSLPLNVWTDFGVPNAPEISIDGSLLTWDPIQSNYNGSITRFRLFVELYNETRNITFDAVPQHNYYDLSSLQLCVNISAAAEVYALTLFAQNIIGEGNGSSAIYYKGTSCPTSSSNINVGLAPVGLAAGITSSIVVCAIVAIFIGAGCCIIVVRKRRKQARLSHTNEDVELNHLRFYSSGQAAHNPQYTWSQDDFLCTDKDIQHLGNFPRQKLTLETFIDQGEFGEVYQGTAIDILGAGTGCMPVAVKTLHKGASSEEQKKFLGEAALMRNFDSPYIVKILGVCIDTNPIYIIMELMPGGDLLHFLRDAKQDFGPALLTMKELIDISVDVAKGCCYLEQVRFIHRDIAARNCLVSSKGADRVVKIGDFGLAKDLYSSDYYQVEGQRKLPVRWMAPEALLQGKFTMESDVWSYGVLLWEIMTIGNQPYPGLTNQEVLQFVSGEGRLDKPERCPKKIYRMMQNCWKKYPAERPHFSEILEDLKKYLDHLNTSSDSSGDESDEVDMERQESTKHEPPLQTDRGIANLAFQETSPENTHIGDDHVTSHCTINSKSGDSSSDERGPI